MDALSITIQLLARSLVLLLPLLVAWLAFRRLSMSKTSNAWIYAMSCLFAAVTFVGLVPWGFGFGSSSAFFFVLAAFSPAMWFGVTAVCDMSRSPRYEPDDDMPILKFRTRQKAMPEALILSKPESNLAGNAAFRTLNSPAFTAPEVLAKVRPTPRPDFKPDLKIAPAPREAAGEIETPVMETPAITQREAPAQITPERSDPPPERKFSKNTMSLLNVAREMRKNANTEDRRLKLLAAPDVKQIGYIKTGAGTA